MSSHRYSEAVARDALRHSRADAVELFVSHHVAELEPSFWERHLGTADPELDEVLEMLVLIDQDCDQSGLVFDFALPDDVSQYVLCVQLDSAGAVVAIAMES